MLKIGATYACIVADTITHRHKERTQARLRFPLWYVLLAGEVGSVRIWHHLVASQRNVMVKEGQWGDGGRNRHLKI